MLPRVRTSAAPAGADLRIFERAAVVTALLLLSRRSAAQAEGRVRGELLDDLVCPPVDDAEMLHERARRLGVVLSQANTVVVIGRPPVPGTGWHPGPRVRRPTTVDSPPTARVQRPAASRRRRECTRASRGAGVVASVGAAVTVGAGGPAHAPVEVAEAYRTAERCVDALTALGMPGMSAGPADLGFVGLLMGAAARTGSDGGFVTAAIGTVLEYDRRRGTVLGQTLESYFAAGGSPARAAELLHVHVNTVTQRLERLSTLLGEDWQRPDRALEIQLALRLHRLRN